MRCPKCGFEQPDGLAECGKCGVIIAKAMRPAAPRPAASPSPSPAPAPMPTGDPAPVPDDAASPGVVVLIGLLLLLFAGAAWWLNFPSIAPLPEGAYINEKHRFAFAPPAEWLQLTRENAKQIFEQHQDRLPHELRGLVANPGFEVGYVRLAGTAAEFSPSLNVVVTELKQDLPPLTESEREQAAHKIFSELSRMLRTYQPEGSSIVEVDGIRSLKLIGTASIEVVLEAPQPVMSVPRDRFELPRIIGHTPEVRKAFAVRTVQLLVPGKKRTYVISYTGENAAFAEIATTFDTITESFRVLDRPPRFGKIVMGSLNGGLIGGGLYLFYLFIRKMVLVLGGRRT